MSALSHDLEVCGILAEEEGVGESDFGNGTDGDNVGRLFEIHRDLDCSLCRVIKGTDSDPFGAVVDVDGTRTVDTIEHPGVLCNELVIQREADAVFNGFIEHGVVLYGIQEALLGPCHADIFDRIRIGVLGFSDREERTRELIHKESGLYPAGALAVVIGEIENEGHVIFFGEDGHLGALIGPGHLLTAQVPVNYALDRDTGTADTLILQRFLLILGQIDIAVVSGCQNGLLCNIADRIHVNFVGFFAFLIAQQRDDFSIIAFLVRKLNLRIRQHGIDLCIFQRIIRAGQLNDLGVILFVVCRLDICDQSQLVENGLGLSGEFGQFVVLDVGLLDQLNDLGVVLFVKGGLDLGELGLFVQNLLSLSGEFGELVVLNVGLLYQLNDLGVVFFIKGSLDFGELGLFVQNLLSLRGEFGEFSASLACSSRTV